MKEWERRIKSIALSGTDKVVEVEIISIFARSYSIEIQLGDL